MHQTKGSRPRRTWLQGAHGPEMGPILATYPGPQLASWGPGWEIGLIFWPLALRKRSVDCRRPHMYAKKIRSGNSALAGKSSSGAPLSLAGALAPVAPPWLRPWYG